MFDGIAEHEVAEREVAERDCFFYEIAYFSICFFLIYFYLTIWYINVKSCFDVLLFFIIILAELALDSSTRLLYLYFIWNPKNSLPLDFGSDGRGFDSHHRRFYFSAPDILFSITIFMIFFHPNAS